MLRNKIYEVWLKMIIKTINYNTIQRLYNKIPIVVYEKDDIDDKIGGQYITKMIGMTYVSYININITLELHQKIAIFFHELGHHYCRNSFCPCWVHGVIATNIVLSEVHAMKFALKQCLRRGYIESYKWLIKIIEKMSNESNRFPEVAILSSKILIKNKKWNHYFKLVEE